MPQDQTQLSVAQPIIEDDGTISQIMRTWAKRVSNELRIVGTGSPEGVVEASQYTEYVDEAVPAVPVRYLKMLPEIGGDRTQGWEVG